MQSNETKPKSKSYKRELAVALLVWFAYVVETKDEGIIETLVWPVFTYSALAFGLQWYSPNGGMHKPNGPTQGFNQRSSQYTNREDEYSDLGSDKPY